MSIDSWSATEKKIARRVYDASLQRELAAVMAHFKALAAECETPQDMWAVQEYLERMGREIDGKYDYRYSQLIFVFARLLREKRFEVQELQGLSEDKIASIVRIATS